MGRRSRGTKRRKEQERSKAANLAGAAHVALRRAARPFAQVELPEGVDPDAPVWLYIGSGNDPGGEPPHLRASDFLKIRGALK